MRFPCLDCGCDTLPDEVDFSAPDNIWLQAVPGDEGHLCIHCFKIRLGRDLQLSDFMLEYEINQHITPIFLEKVNEPS
jgi:hypothetical protein